MAMLYDAIVDVIISEPDFSDPLLTKQAYNEERITRIPWAARHRFWRDAIEKVLATPEETWVQCPHLIYDPEAPSDCVRLSARYVFAAVPHLRACHACWERMKAEFKTVTRLVPCDACGTPAKPGLVASVCVAFLVVSIHLCPACKAEVGGPPSD